jgi:uncharacterized protein (DUF1697 family)
MTIGIAFIRGINVGGKHKVSMETLRALCEDAGLCDARTYIASGNLVFRCSSKSMTRAGAKIEAIIEKENGFRPGVVVRSIDELKEVVAANPFAKEKDIDPSKLLVMFLSEPLSTESKKALRMIKASPERIAAAESEIYLYYPDGIAETKLPFTSVEKAAKVSGTCRNWNTVQKVLAMAGELSRG